MMEPANQITQISMKNVTEYAVDGFVDNKTGLISLVVKTEEHDLDIKGRTLVGLVPTGKWFETWVLIEPKLKASTDNRADWVGTSYTYTDILRQRILETKPSEEFLYRNRPFTRMTKKELELFCKGFKYILKSGNNVTNWKDMDRKYSKQKRLLHP